MYNRIITQTDTDEQISLGGPEGGVLILQPPGEAAGAMTRTDLENRVWQLLREPGPDSGYPPPIVGDFSQSVVDRDLNIAIAQFISATGIAPALSERRVDLPVLVVPNGDYPLPPDLVSLTQIEYTPAGQNVYRLLGLEFGQWNDRFGNVQNPDTGQPYFFRRPYAGYVRLQPIPSLGNAVGVGIGAITFLGTATPGQQIAVTMSNNVITVTTQAYTVSPTDTLATIAVAVATAMNVSAACTGAGAFLQPPSPVSNVVNLSSVNPPGTGIWYFVTVTGSGMLSATPTSQTYLNPNGDIITFYYTSLGTVMAFPGDSPGIPPQFHMALVYRLLADYWKIKQDIPQSREYALEFQAMVKEGKTYVYDSDTSTMPSIATNDDDSASWDLII